MASLQSKKGHYYALFYDPHRRPARKWVTLRTTDRRNATLRLAALDREYALGTFDPWRDAAPTPGLTLQDGIARYSAARRTRRARTIRADESVLGLFEATLPPGILLSHVEGRHVERFLARASLADSTRTTYFARLSAFFSWATEERHVRDNPVANVRPPKQRRKVAEFLTREQYEHLLRKIETDATDRAGTIKPGEVIWLIDVVRFAVGSGLRLGELCNLQWSAVNTRTGFVTVQNTATFTTKSGNERAVYVAGEARDVLRRRAAGRAGDYVFVGTGGDKLNEEYVSKRFRHYADEAKLPKGVHFHTLRHTYAAWCVMGGVDLFRVKELLGHASIETTQQYAHLAPKSFRNEIDRVFGDGAQPGRVEEHAVVYTLAA